MSETDETQTYDCDICYCQVSEYLRWHHNEWHAQQGGYAQ